MKHLMLFLALNLLAQSTAEERMKQGFEKLQRSGTLAQQGKFEEAEGLLTRALERIGQDPTVHDHLGDVYFKLGKIKEAITQWQASLKDFRSPAGIDSEPEDVAKVTRKLDAARVKLAKESK